MTHKNIHHGLAVITGASRGIGAEYARALAKRGYSLLLVARDEARLQQVAREILDKEGVEVTTASLDLSEDDAARQLMAAAGNGQRPVDILVNNAGFGMYGKFANMPLPRIQAMLELHINAVVESTRLFLPSMIERRSGAIINVASLAGLFPIPYMAEYAATKSFLISFSEALAEEVQESGVTIQACCPGYTVSEFHQTAGHTPRNPFPPQTAKAVVQASLRGLDKGRTRVTVGWQGRLSMVFTGMIPRRILIQLTGRRVQPQPDE